MSDADGLFRLDEAAVTRILKRLSSKGFDAIRDIEPELFEATFGTLGSALDKVFGQPKYGEHNFDLLEQLRHNTTVFAAFKTHRQQNDLCAELFDTEGKVRSFAEFRKATAPILSNYNTNWLQSEYNTAMIRAQTAAQWSDIQKTKEIYPHLQWLPSTSVSQREAHKSLYYKVFALDDPFLSSNMPGSLWNCKCGIRSTNEPITDKSTTRAAIKQSSPAAPGLDNNPGVSGELFTRSHPYFDVGSRKITGAITLQAEKILTERSRNAVRKHFKERLKENSLQLNVANGPVNSLALSYQDIKNITGKPHKFNALKNRVCYSLQEVLDVAQYEGCSPDVKGMSAKGHAMIEQWHYYSFDLNKEKSYITIAQRFTGEYKFHSIQDGDHFKPIKVKEKPQ